MHYIIVVALLVAGVIHLLPLVGVLGAEKLSSLYGVTISEPNLVILMQHRAVLFGVLGAYMVYAAFAPPHRLLALAAGLVSVVSFLWIAYSVGGYNANIGRVVSADLVALSALLIGLAAQLLSTRNG